ncbi:MAG TPA: Rieske (2Fe-2S) protein [Chitinophagaceae bacterium]|nr:Rieske (2Fe-2S) protein [Chitinophagaceae bacterium]
MERRNFIKSTCNICLLGTAGFLAAQLPACSPASFPVFKTDVNDKKITIPLRLFDQSPLQIVRPKNMFYDIAVRKKEDNSYSALLLLCTHQQTQLTVTGNGYSCPLHESNFDKNGNVIKGPAETALHHFITSVSNNNLIIQI